MLVYTAKHHLFQDKISKPQDLLLDGNHLSERGFITTDVSKWNISCPIVCRQHFYVHVYYIYEYSHLSEAYGETVAVHTIRLTAIQHQSLLLLNARSRNHNEIVLLLRSVCAHFSLRPVTARKFQHDSMENAHAFYHLWPYHTIVRCQELCTKSWHVYHCQEFLFTGK